VLTSGTYVYEINNYSNQYQYSLTGDNASHPYYGGSAGYNIVGLITLLGEYKYQPLGTLGTSPNSYSFKNQLYGGGVRFNFRNSKKLVPFVLITLGGDQYTISGPGASVSYSGMYEDVGGGVSYYITKNFGVRPEIRLEVQDLFVSNSSTSSITEIDRVVEGGSLFFQFGGRK
jgi:hypothetical protein